jgi:hypothetical protein
MGGGDNRLVLVLSNKKDAFYCVTAADCSCPSRSWHPGQRCKHQRKFFPEQQPVAAKPAAVVERKPFKPFIEDVVRPAKVSTPLYVDCLPDPTNRDIAYHSIKGDREMWPMCEA